MHYHAQIIILFFGDFFKIFVFNYVCVYVGICHVSTCGSHRHQMPRARGKGSFELPNVSTRN